MTIVIENCQLELDLKRGVIYVHSPRGRTLVRVCQIYLTDYTFDEEKALLDIISSKAAILKDHG